MHLSFISALMAVLGSTGSLGPEESDDDNVLDLHAAASQHPGVESVTEARAQRTKESDLSYIIYADQPCSTF